MNKNPIRFIAATISVSLIGLISRLDYRGIRIFPGRPCSFSEKSSMKYKTSGVLKVVWGASRTCPHNFLGFVDVGCLGPLITLGYVEGDFLTFFE